MTHKNDQHRHIDQHEGQSFTTSVESNALSSCSWLRHLFVKKELSRCFMKFWFASQNSHFRSCFVRVAAFLSNNAAKMFPIFDRIGGGKNCRKFLQFKTSNQSGLRVLYHVVDFVQLFLRRTSIVCLPLWSEMMYLLFML